MTTPSSTPPVPVRADIIELLYRAAYRLTANLKHIPREPGAEDGGFEVWMNTRLLKEIREVLLEDWKVQAAVCPEKLCQVPGFGDHMSVDSWLGAVNTGCFIDEDGSGYLATADGETTISVWPSLVTLFKFPLPEWATHVVWYNK